MPAERIFYATHSVSLGGTPLKGVQSLSVSSNNGLEPVFQLGQCNHVELVPSVPECEVTITRSIFGGPALTIDINNNCTTAEEILNAEAELVVGSDAGGFTVSNALLSGYSVNFSTEGVFTEELTYVGDTLTSGGSFAAFDDEIHLPRRQDWSGPAGATSARLTLAIARDPVYVLGQYKPLKRFVQFPVEVTLEIGYLLPQGGGFTADDPPNCAVDTANKQDISISACGSTWLVRDAVLSSIGYSGGDVGGGNVEVTYTYTSYSNVAIS
jgi:hypothetical protein